MAEKKKYQTYLIVAAVFCGVGCLLMVANTFIESEIDLWTAALGFNGIGLAFFVFGQKKKPTE